MSEEQDRDPAEPAQQRQMETDWDPDRFPTSAKPVFRKTGLLIAVILALCAAVYVLSDRSAQEEAAERRAQDAEQEFFGNEETTLNADLSVGE